MIAKFPLANYTLQFTYNALVRLEQVTGFTPDDLAALSDKGKIKLETMRALIWAGLIEHHKDLTVEDVGPIIDEVGIQPAFLAASNAMRAALTSEGKANGSHPRRAISASTGAST